MTDQQNNNNSPTNTNISTTTPEEDDVAKLRMTKTSELKVKKLELGRDFRTWSGQIELHFRELTLWQHVLHGEDPPEIDNYTTEQLVNKFKEDLITALDSQLIKKVLHLENANRIYQKLFKMFIGTKEGGLRTMSERIYRFTYRGNTFVNLNEYENLVNQYVEIGGKPNFKEITLLMLDKLPKQHVNLTYSLKKNIEKMETNERKIFDNTIDTLIGYFQDAGLYVMRRKNREIRYNQRPFAFQARASNKNFQPCRKCGQRHNINVHVSSATTAIN